MGNVNTQAIQQAEIIRLESEMNNLWGELNTSNIPHALRLELEKQLGQCEEDFKAMLGGQYSPQELENKLLECDMTLAVACVNQAEHEIPKTEHSSSSFLALEGVRQQLNSGKLTPIKARHAVKEVMRHHS